MLSLEVVGYVCWGRVRDCPQNRLVSRVSLSNCWSTPPVLNKLIKLIGSVLYGFVFPVSANVTCFVLYLRELRGLQSIIHSLFKVRLAADHWLHENCVGLNHRWVDNCRHLLVVRYKPWICSSLICLIIGGFGVCHFNCPPSAIVRRYRRIHLVGRHRRGLLSVHFGWSKIRLNYWILIQIEAAAYCRLFWIRRLVEPVCDCHIHSICLDGRRLQLDVVFVLTESVCSVGHFLSVGLGVVHHQVGIDRVQLSSLFFVQIVRNILIANVSGRVNCIISVSVGDCLHVGLCQFDWRIFVNWSQRYSLLFRLLLQSVL